MKSETTISTYRGNEIHTTIYTPETNGNMSTRYAIAIHELQQPNEEDEKPKVYDTAEEAIKAAQKDIEERLGPATDDEIREAADRALSDYHGPDNERIEARQQAAQALADAIESYRNGGDRNNTDGAAIRAIHAAAQYAATN
jgi:hypothetical protein